MLDADAATVLCADHAALRDGRSPVERHHLGGRGWNIVLDVTPNWHRVLSALQRMRKSVTKESTAELMFGLGDLHYAIGDYLERKEDDEAAKNPGSSRRKT